MSWLGKIVSKISARRVEQLAEEAVNAMPTANCLTVESMSTSELPADTEDENPIKQRRYFVKKGLYVDHESETTVAAGSAEALEEIPDRSPVDLKSLFPKLSLR